MRATIWCPAAILMTLLTAACGGKGCGFTETSSVSVASTSAARDPVDVNRQWRKTALAGKDPIDLTNRIAAIIDAELSRPAADPSDLTAQAGLLGADVAGIFEFVRDQIALEPYAGVLRGARGTLAAGGGNALDRALLAQELLRHHGRETRLVRGVLPAEQAKALLTRFLSAPIPSILTASQSSDPIATPQQVEQWSSSLGLSPNDLNDLFRSVGERRAKFWQGVDARRDQEYEFLVEHLKQAPAKAKGRSGSLARLEARLCDHTWLQVLESDGRWADFDPTLPNASLGVAYGSNPKVIPAIERDRYHRLRFDLVYHTVQKGTPRQDVLLTGDFSAADALFHGLGFRIDPADAVVDANALLSMTESEAFDTLKAVERFAGVLRWGDTETISQSFGLDGNFGDESRSDSTFTKLVVVLRFTGPGREPAITTRQLVTAADIKKPGFVAPLLEWQLLLQPQWISRDLVSFQTLRDLSSVAKTAASTATTSLTSLTSFPDSGASAPWDLLQLALMRQAITASLLSTSERLRVFVDQPLLTIAALSLGSGDGHTEFKERRHVDIVENTVRFVDATEPSERAFEAALRQGVADSTLENEFLTFTRPSGTVSSGLSVLDALRTNGKRLTPVTPGASKELRKIGLGTDDAEWIRTNEKPTTYLLVAATPAASAAWWSVQADGTAVLRSSGGGGQAGTEFTINKAKVANAVKYGLKIFFFGHCVHTVAHTAGETMSNQPLNPASFRNMAFCTAASTVSAASIVVGSGAAGIVVLLAEFVHLLGG